MTLSLFGAFSIGTSGHFTKSVAVIDSFNITKIFLKRKTMSTETSREPEKVFVDIDPDNPVTEIESLCMNCGRSGVTRLLLTKIPHFKEIIVMAFDCPHCHFRNSEIQSAGQIQDEGCVYSGTLCANQDTVKTDLNRQIVKSESAIVKLPEIQFEIPAATQRGVLTTVEGILERAIEGLSAGQDDRREADHATFIKVNETLEKLKSFMNGEKPFKIVLDDPAGNSYLENPRAPEPDPSVYIVHYQRTADQNEQLGLAAVDERSKDVVGDFKTKLKDSAAGNSDKSAEASAEDGEGTNEVPEVLEFPAVCNSCHAPSTTKMYVMNIPYFKEAVIMSTTCDYCGYKSNEVKAGGAISTKGKKISLRVVDAEDLSRDILKSETCGLKVPEVDLELQAGTLGGKFTTVEGLLSQVYEELESKTPFLRGDSGNSERRKVFEKFLAKLSKLINLEVLPFTLILDDPLANSYLQNLYAPDPDPNMTIEEYSRSWEQNEVLGLNDMIVEGYNGPLEAEHNHHDESA